MVSFGNIAFALLVSFFPSAVVAAAANAGFDAFAAAQVMVSKASHSWEWGTASEALLELYNNELSVFGSNPFPGGKVPDADAGIVALKYAKQFIRLNAQTLVADDAVGDPASLGVSAILLGQSNSQYQAAADSQADYILNMAPKWSNGAISHRADVAEIWADNMAMSFPFLAYQAVQKGNTALMSQVVAQCGLQRDVLKTSQYNSWRHIIGPQSQDTGLWATGNGWVSYGMVRVLYTMKKWSGSASMTSEMNQLKGWIQEILTGALASSLDGGLLRNYVNDQSWWGEVSGTALLAAVAYRMAVIDPAMFPQKYIDWADAARAAVAKNQADNGVFSPAVNPYVLWDRNKYTTGSPEGQAFAVFLYTAYRDCVNAKVCASPPAATTIADSDLGLTDIMTLLHAPITFSAMHPPPTDTPCGTTESCDLNGCAGSFQGLNKYPVCTAGPNKGCQCTATTTICGARQSCDLNGCAGSYGGDSKAYPQCTGNFAGCECLPTSTTCGTRQSCDLNGCSGGFDLTDGKAYCKANFVGCECAATSWTCGKRQGCDLNNCQGRFGGTVDYARCTNFFKGCECIATTKTCGAPQDCGLNNCVGSFDPGNGKAYCTNNFVGCPCAANPATCGTPQSCDMNNCQGSFGGSVSYAKCTNLFKGCICKATDNTCGAQQSCDLDGCDGGYDSNGVARCQGNFSGCKCKPTGANTCGTPQNCDLNGCAGTFDSNSRTARCRGKFAGCVCNPVESTCGTLKSCSLDGCDGGYISPYHPVCLGNYYLCPCVPGPIWVPRPPSLPQPNLQNSIIEGDTMTVQLYQGYGQSATEYAFLLSDGKYGASADTVWSWNNIKDSHGVTWSVQVHGNCKTMTYTNSAGARGSMTPDVQYHDYTCGSFRCTEYEAIYMGEECASDQGGGFCDYRSSCSPWRGGSPIHISGGS